MSKVIIYGLFDPIPRQLRYIGKTSGTIRRRGQAHVSDVRRGRVYIPRHRWIAGLLAEGQLPEISEIERVPAPQWAEAEQFWIAYFRFIGCDLLNATDGGDGLVSYRHREDTKAKQSAAALARYQRLGEREKTGTAVSAAFAIPEIKANLREGRKKVARGSVQVGIDALIAYSRSPEGRAARSARRKGVKVSAQTLEKMRTASLGKKWTEDQKARFAASRTGKKHSAATIEKMRASALARNSRRRLSVSVTT